MTGVVAGPLAAATATVFFLAACQSVSATDPSRVFSLTVVPEQVTFDALGGTQQLVGTLKNGDGREFPLGNRVWTSGNEAVATVTEEGLVTAVANGTATITLSADVPSSGFVFLTATSEITVQTGAQTSPLR